MVTRLRRAACVANQGGEPRKSPENIVERALAELTLRNHREQETRLHRRAANDEAVPMKSIQTVIAIERPAIAVESKWNCCFPG
eukprot:5212352-Pyramimonas_sp.AAC.1